MLNALWSTGYSCSDIIGTLFKVTKNSDIPEATKLAFLREIGFCHMRIAEGSASKLQLLGLVGRLAKIGKEAAEGESGDVQMKD